MQRLDSSFVSDDAEKNVVESSIVEKLRRKVHLIYYQNLTESVLCRDSRSTSPAELLLRARKLQLWRRSATGRTCIHPMTHTTCCSCADEALSWKRNPHRVSLDEAVPYWDSGDFVWSFPRQIHSVLIHGVFFGWFFAFVLFRLRDSRDKLRDREGKPKCFSPKRRSRRQRRDSILSGCNALCTISGRWLFWVCCWSTRR